jgi:cell division transport system permease protein
MVLARLLKAAAARRDTAEEDDTPPPTAALVPTDSIAGRSLAIVIAIMTFLAALAAGAALLVSNASSDWRSEVAREATVQIRPAPGRDIEADLRKVVDILSASPAVRDVRVYTKAESEALLAPWLGQGLDLSELPMPRMVVVTLDPARGSELPHLKDDLARDAPTATFDDHRLWIARLGSMAGTAVAASAVIFALTLAALGIVIASATRAAVATNREIVDVLHLVGAADSFIAEEFQRRFLGLGLRGALAGGGAALALFALAGLISRRWTATPGSDQIEAMFGAFALGPLGYILILVLSGAVAIVTGILSRAIVLHHLRRLV